MKKVLIIILLFCSIDCFAFYCNKCGKENPDDAIYCSNCGAKLTSGDIKETEKEAIDLGKYDSIGIITYLHSPDLSSYKVAKIQNYGGDLNFVASKLNISGSYSVSYPVRLLDYGLQYTHKVSFTVLYFRYLYGSTSGTDNLNWINTAGEYATKSNSWDFTTQDISVGMGFDLTNSLFQHNSKSKITLFAGNYSVTLTDRQMTTQHIIFASALYPYYSSGDSTDYRIDKYSDRYIYGEVEYNDYIYLDHSRTAFININLGYRYASPFHLDGYKEFNNRDPYRFSQKEVNFNFSGFEFGTGIGYYF